MRGHQQQIIKENRQLVSYYSTPPPFFCLEKLCTLTCGVKVLSQLVQGFAANVDHHGALIIQPMRGEETITKTLGIKNLAVINQLISSNRPCHRFNTQFKVLGNKNRLMNRIGHARFRGEGPHPQTLLPVLKRKLFQYVSDRINIIKKRFFVIRNHFITLRL